MGRRNKTYQKDLHQQAYEALTGMQAFGDSKKEDIMHSREHDKDITAGKIYSFNTYKTYWKHVKYFVGWVKEHHPDCTTLKKSKGYVSEWLQERVDKGLSAWTIQTEEAAVNKLFKIRKDDPDRFQAPKRRREDIKRSRLDVADDRHFSKTNNRELIDFCCGTGLRREGLQTIRGKDLLTKEEIETEIRRIENIPTGNRTANDKTKLSIYLDTRLFTSKGQEYFVHTKEKGGKERISPIIGSHTQEIVDRFRNTPPDGKVWEYVHSHADIHGYRGEYATALYKMYTRPIDQIPYDRVNKGTCRRYQSEVYVCRGDEAGKKLDRHAMLVCSKALGHNRLEVIAKNYLRGL